MLESEHFYYINACRAKEKSGPFTDVLSYNSNDGVITDQEPVQIQQRKENSQQKTTVMILAKSLEMTKVNFL